MNYSWHNRPDQHTERLFQFYQVKRVFLACPGDLVAERSRFPRLLETVNNLRAHSLGFHLLPIGWERVIPSFGRPQDLINLELYSADLVVVMFWNRIGSPSSTESPKSGTVEEFEVSSHLHESLGRPVVWVYFKKPTAEHDTQLNGVFSFRKQLEDGKQLFFREYESITDWEEMFREHLVAYLDGLTRWNLDEPFARMNPDDALLQGRFLAEGIYREGPSLRLTADLDGDGNDETVSFCYSHGGYSLTISRFDAGLYLPLPAPIQDQERKRPFSTFHLAIKDVTNDGLPEVVLAAWDGLIELLIAVWGFTEQGKEGRSLSEGGFSLLGTLEGQAHAIVREGGTILLPYGSAGLATIVHWEGSRFEVAA